MDCGFLQKVDWIPSLKKYGGSPINWKLWSRIPFWLCLQVCPVNRTVCHYLHSLVFAIWRKLTNISLIIDLYGFATECYLFLFPLIYTPLSPEKPKLMSIFLPPQLHYSGMSVSKTVFLTCFFILSILTSHSPSIHATVTSIHTSTITWNTDNSTLLSSKVQWTLLITLKRSINTWSLNPLPPTSDKHETSP